MPIFLSHSLVANSPMSQLTSPNFLRVKNKMTKGDGMSYAEFSYPLMQAWDWWHMHITKGVSMQIGGSDQFGNITAGITAVKYLSTHHPDPAVRALAQQLEPLGFTVPLLTTSSGTKFGKSAGNAIWLDNDKTKSFDLYGYFLRTPDSEVAKYLKMFTFMPISDIDALVAEHMQEPHLRKAQHKLAHDFVGLIHGTHEADLVRSQHRQMFSKDPVELTSPLPDPDLKAQGVSLNTMPKIDMKLPQSLVNQKAMGRILFAAGLVDSVSEGHRVSVAGGAYVGGSPKHEPMNDGLVSWQQIKVWGAEETRKFLVHGDLLLLRKGKNNIRVVRVVPDEEYVLSGEKYRGMPWSVWREMVEKAKVKENISEADRAAVEKLLEDEDTRRLLEIKDEEAKSLLEEAKRVKKATRAKESKAEKLADHQDMKDLAEGKDGAEDPKI